MPTRSLQLEQKTACHTAASISDYIALLKPRVMSLVVFTGLIGLMIAPGEIHPFIAITAVFCIALGSGAAGAINMWYERDIDAIMKRTQQRPIPAGRIMPEKALEFAVPLAFASVFIMAVAVNYVAAAVLLLAILFYVYVYTIFLKRRTPQNIVIGGAAGAFPPMIGWASVTGTISLEAILLFGIIFFWTPPHFWALALHRSGDYEKAGIPMLPVVAGHTQTKWQMLLYTLMLFPVTFAPVFLGTFGWLYGATALTLNGLFLWHALRVMRTDDSKIAMKMFGFSILYLFVIFAIMPLDQWITRVL